MDNYESYYNRVKYIVNYLDNELPYSKLDNSPLFWTSLQYHKKNIPPDNKLQILVSEGIFLLKLIWDHEKNKVINFRY